MDGYRMVLTADPENIKAMLTTQFKDFGKGKMLSDAFMPFLGNGILSTDGQQWHDARSLMRPLFMRERVSDLDLFERNVQRLIPRLGSGENVEFDDLVFRYTLDTVSEFLLGTSVGSLGDPSNGFTTAFNEVQEVQSVIMRAGLVSPAFHFKLLLIDMKASSLGNSSQEVPRKHQSSRRFPGAVHLPSSFTTRWKFGTKKVRHPP
jgi:hypothetical protein